jgi:hypothetical protein
MILSETINMNSDVGGAIGIFVGKRMIKGFCCEKRWDAIGAITK